MFGLFGKGDKTENKDVRKSQGEKRVPGDEIPEEDLREIVGGKLDEKALKELYFQGANKDKALCDVREEISEENADQDYAAGQMNDVDGWD